MDARTLDMMVNKPILITGCARSGTSMTAGIINVSGAWGGKLSGPTRFNKKGMFENKEIRQDLVKPYLRSINADPMGQDPLPDIESCKLISVRAINNWRIRIIDILRSQGYPGNNQIWFYKGAKMCLFWPIWARAFPDARWVIVRRKTGDIVNSCLRTTFMRAYKKASGWYYWVDQHKERFIEMHQAGLNIREVWPQKMIGNDFSEIEDVVKSLGLNWDYDKAIEFVEPALWSGKGV